MDELQFEGTKRQIETIRLGDADGIEYWSARDLMMLLGYTRWENFAQAIDRAKKSLMSTDGVVHNHFRDATKKVPLGSGASRDVEDVHLTRYGAYLVAMNGSTAIPAVAHAQTYFVTQTRKQEVLEDATTAINNRVVEDKRLAARAKLKETEGKVERSVYQRGISSGKDFAIFKNNHISALYGGLNTNQIKRMRKIPTSRALADFDSEVELSAKEFALSMTNHNINDKNLTGPQRLNQEVVDNSLATRTALLGRGIKPEALPPSEDIKKVEKRHSKEQLAATEGMTALVDEIIPSAGDGDE